MRLTRISVENHSRINDLQVEVRGHMVIVGANDVGKSSLLRLLNLLLGSSTAQLFTNISVKDLRDETAPLRVGAWFDAFDDTERRLFPREIDIAKDDRSESLEIRLEVSVDSEDNESLVISRWCPGRGEVRALSREQLAALGWRYLNATRASSAAQLDGANGAVQILLRAVQEDLGDEKETLGSLLASYNENLRTSTALTKLRVGMAGHLSSSMPRTVTPDDLSIRTATDPNESVLDGVSLFFTSADGTFVSLSEQSDGIRQLMSMTLFDLAEGTANVIAIDEPELHLHPLSQRTVAELLTGKATQKIVVTHSPYVVQRFDPTQVVAISPGSNCHQIDPTAFPVKDRVQAHWWSPRMLEALTARVAILVEGVADRLIIEGAARARGISLDRVGAMVFELGGADNFPTVYKLIGPTGFDVTVLGLVDKAESRAWVGAVGGKAKDVIGTAVFISDTDLEDEYCRGIGPVKVTERLVAALVAREDGILSSCGVSAKTDITAAKLASFCRSSSRGGNRKVSSALAVANAMTKDDSTQISSVSDLLDRVEALTST